VDEREDSVPDGEASAAGRRTFLMLAGAAAAGGLAVTVAPGAIGSADAATADVTIDQLPAAAALTGPEVLHGVQTTGGVASDVAISATQLQQFVNPQVLVNPSSSSYTWAPPVTNIVASNTADYLTILLPGSASVSRLPTITVLQTNTGRVTFAPADSNAVVRALPLSLNTNLTHVRTRGTYAVATITVIPTGTLAVWVVSGDIEAY
jgi:hypothetical protein